MSDVEFRRVLVIGPPGAGKTWIARRLASNWRLEHTELDAFKLKPNRGLASPAEFKAGLEAVLSRERWLLDGNW